MFNILRRTILQDRRLSNLKHFGSMKFVRSSRIGWIALIIGMTTPLFITERVAAQPSSPEKFSVQTNNFALNFVRGSAYKKIREVTLLGDLCRLEDPHNNFRGVLNFVSPDRTRAVMFAFQLKDGENVPVRPQGLDLANNYTIHELNPAPGRAAMPQKAKIFTGAELIREGLLPSGSHAVDACVIELGP